MTELTDEPGIVAADAERPGVDCSSCGAANPARNQFCEHCGWRLAAEVPRRTGFGWVAWAGVGVLVGVLLWVAFGRSGDPTAPPEVAVEQAASSSVVTSTAAVEIREVEPITVTASSERDGFEAYHLIDGDRESAWKDASLRGEGAELIFTFAPAVTLTEVVLHMPVDEEAFYLNARIRGVEISFEDSPDVIITELADEPGPHRVSIPGITTTQVVIRVTATYEPVPFAGHEPYDELSVTEVSFRGSMAGGGAGTAPDQGG